jgi:hypothetical protein
VKSRMNDWRANVLAYIEAELKISEWRGAAAGSR